LLRSDYAHMSLGSSKGLKYLLSLKIQGSSFDMLFQLMVCLPY
jgi:hypothetical protein